MLLLTAEITFTPIIFIRMKAVAILINTIRLVATVSGSRARLRRSDTVVWTMLARMPGLLIMQMNVTVAGLAHMRRGIANMTLLAITGGS